MAATRARTTGHQCQILLRRGPCRPLSSFPGGEGSLALRSYATFCFLREPRARAMPWPGVSGPMAHHHRPDPASPVIKTLFPMGRTVTRRSPVPISVRSGRAHFSYALCAPVWQGGRPRLSGVAALATAASRLGDSWPVCRHAKFFGWPPRVWWPKGTQMALRY